MSIAPSRVSVREVHPVLHEAAAAAYGAYRDALTNHSREQMAEIIGIGGDGTPTSWLDQFVEAPVLEVFERHGVNVLSEEVGWIDRGSLLTVVVDPLDGTANAVAGVPLSCFSAALAIEGVIHEAFVNWLDGGRVWTATRNDESATRVSGRTDLDGASLSMLRPKPETLAAWTSIAGRAARVKILGTSVLEGCLVADGAIDAFCDAGGDVHRIVDIAAMALVVERAGGVVRDAFGRPFTLEPDLTLRWSGVAAASEELADQIIEEITAGRWGTSGV